MTFALDALHNHVLHATSEQTDAKSRPKTIVASLDDLMLIVPIVVARIQVQTITSMPIRAKIILVGLITVTVLDLMAFDTTIALLAAAVFDLRSIGVTSDFHCALSAYSRYCNNQ